MLDGRRFSGDHADDTVRRPAYRRRRFGVALCAALVSVAGAAGPKSGSSRKNEPWVQFKLADLEVPATSTSLMNLGASMLTVHLVDANHLLLTYSLHKLVPRIVGDPESHEDRLVGAELVELPGGRILDTAEWHMHDHARYLWKLGEGRFLLRIGDHLSTFAPVANLGAGKPFERTSFPSRHLQPALVEVSPDYGMVTLESLVATGPAIVNGDVPTGGLTRPTRAILDFYRIHGSGSVSDPVIATNAGSVQAPQPFLLPLDADGYLWAEDTEARGAWKMTFDSFGGKSSELGVLNSSCRPRLEMASHSQFLALSCRGTDDKVRLGAFGLDGHETWEENFGALGAPTFTYAAEAGRFAMSFTVESITPPNEVQGAAQQSSLSQELRIYQTESGDLLLKQPLSPAFKTAENFDMTQDGSEVALIKGDAVAVYKLPPATRRDRDDLAEVQKFAPPLSEAQVVLSRLMARHVNSGADDLAAAASGTSTANATAPASTAVAATRNADRPQSAPAATAGPVAALPINDEVPSARRKPPTLLNPGETPEFRPKPGTAQ